MLKNCDSETGSKEGRYARILVDVDLSKPLVRGFKLRCNGEECWVDFKYENLPIFCFYCGLIGHGERKCVRRCVDTKNSELREGQFGDWIRATNGREFNNFWTREGGVRLLVGCRKKGKL